MTQPEEQAADQEQSSPPSTSNQHLLPTDHPAKSFYKFHHHSISDSTAYSSNDSSPTTTISTVDDSSATEPSPGSSPDSPPPSTFEPGMLRARTSDEAQGTFFELQKQPPARKGRNLKNLAVDTSRNNGRAASTTSLPLTLQPLHADTMPSIISPAFVKPPSPPKRKPSNLGLTLRTPGSKAVPQEMKLAIPPTPAFGRPSTLRHFQSSPSLPVLPGLNSNTDMLRRANRPAMLETIFSPIEPPSAIPLVQEEGQNFDVPLSREEKPDAYPDGPICVYTPYVDLYLEPTAGQCRQYDVIMNVASEVLNPLVEHAEIVNAEPEIRIDGGGGIQFAPRRAQLAVPGGPETSTANECSPTTPKATPLSPSFPAEAHDLLRLCKLIEERISQGKRVLVHCQCGVSRSASLVVAYGLYKNPTMSVQEAYDAVKARSKWIGPNMNLIMQLQEFRTSLARGGLLPSNRLLTPITPSSAMSDWRGPFSMSPLGPSRTAPLPMSNTESAQQLMPNNDLTAVTPGPASAPLHQMRNQAAPVPTRLTRAVSTSKRASAYVDPSGHVIPVLQIVAADSIESTPEKITVPATDQLREDSGSTTPTDPLSSPRSAEFAMTPLIPSKSVESADDFGILSPTTEFSSSPFDRPALLASLGMGSMQSEDTPRRALSLRKPQPASTTSSGLAPAPAGKLRGRISSPSLREQQRLKSFQAQIEAKLSLTNGASSPTIGGMDDALMSTRATEFTKNPFAFPAIVPETQEPNFTPNEPASDPRSPAQAGVNPITRHISDVL
ncbi:tyrosine/serine/threonine protein phosphatase [Elasticomyces elasticus]|nr:tyrosine/serine/threonine protein phosphatase [Elasticomyces elasticus]